VSKNDSDPVWRAIDQAYDDKMESEQTKREDEITRGFSALAQLDLKVADAKARLRGGKTDTEMFDELWNDQQKLLNLIAECPGFEPLPSINRQAFLELGFAGLRSRWYRQLKAAVMGSYEVDAALQHLRNDVKRFQDRFECENIASFPEESQRDWIVERVFPKNEVDRFDFSNLTKQTAEDLKFNLSSIDTWIFCLQSANERYRTACA
jgi:hypothetical protein